MSADRQPELKLALLQVLLRERQEVALDRPLARQEVVEGRRPRLLEELLHVLGRTLVFEPDLEDLRLARSARRAPGDIDDAVRRLEGLAERHRPDAEARAVRRDAVERMRTTSVVKVGSGGSRSAITS